MLLAHISDIHLPTTKPRLFELFGKRFLSFLSWHHKRKNRHLLTMSDLLLADLRAHKPDHICVTGDIVNASLASEFDQAKTWLEALAPREQISFVAGNHDALVRGAVSLKNKFFGPWMMSDDGHLAPPYVQVKRGVAFIGVNTAVPTLPFMATGRVGVEQMGRLAKLLEETAKKGLYRVVLIHHPPLPGMAKYRKCLQDADVLERLFKEKGAELVLHGHNHHPILRVFQAPTGTGYVFGGGSASMACGKEKGGAHYHLLRLVKGGGEVIHRVYNPEENRFITQKTEMFFHKKNKDAG